jgi:hypothetical protein
MPLYRMHYALYAYLLHFTTAANAQAVVKATTAQHYILIPNLVWC